MSKKSKDKQAALEHALKQIEKQFGKGAVMRLGEQTHMDIETISTGALSIDIALGVGGLPRGRITEIYGPESSGKTTLALHVVAEAQKNGGEAAFIDVEHALNPVYAKQLGVDIDTLLVSQPDTGEQALEIAEALICSNAVDVVVIDSVAAMVPRAELEGDMGDAHIGLQARLMSQALRKMTGHVSKSKCVCIFINQLREKVGVMFGSPETTPGGRALKFYASIRIDIRKREALKAGTDIIGNRTRIKIAKNKVAPPFKELEVDLMYGEGISQEGEVLDLAALLDIVDKAGAWYSYGEERLGQGRDNAKEFFKDNPEVMEEIAEKVRKEAYRINFSGKATTVRAPDPIEIIEDEDEPEEKEEMSDKKDDKSGKKEVKTAKKDDKPMKKEKIAKIEVTEEELDKTEIKEKTKAKATK